MSGQIKRTASSIEDGMPGDTGFPDQTALELRIAEASARRAKVLSDKKPGPTTDSGIPASIRREDLPPLRSSAPISAPVMPTSNPGNPVTPLRPVPEQQKPDSEITAADLLNPAALELRLTEARVRRNSALAERAARTAPPGLATPLGEPAQLRAPDVNERLPGPAPSGPLVRPGSVFMGVTFAAGLLIGGAVTALVASPDLRSWVVGQLSGETTEVVSQPEITPTRAIAPEAEQVSQSRPPMSDDLVSQPVSYDELTLLPALQPSGSTIEFRPMSPARTSPHVVQGVITPEPGGSASLSTASVPLQLPVLTGALPDRPDDALNGPLVAVAAPKAAVQDFTSGFPTTLSSPPSTGSSDSLTALRVPALPLPAVVDKNAWKSDITVYVHYPPSAAEEARAAVAELQAREITDVTSIPAGFSISTSNIRYYHDSDLAAAAALADALNDGQGTQGLQARDFTSFRPQPKTGLVEIWLAGTAPTVQRTGPTRTTEVSGARRQQLIEDARRTAQQREVERLLLNRLGNN